MACREGDCEEQVRTMNRIVEAHGAVLNRANAHVRAQGAMVLALSLGFLGLAAYGFLAPVWLFFWLGLIPGAIFAVFGVVLLARKAPELDGDAPEPLAS